MSVFEDSYTRECAEASYWMLYYPDHKADYERSTLDDDRMDIILSTPPPVTVVGGKNSVRVTPDETGNKAVKLISYNRGHIKEWLRLCEDVETSLKTELKVFLKLRRKYRRLLHKDDWKSRLQINYPAELDRAKGGDGSDLASEMFVSQSTFRDWWNKIIRITAIEAARRGLFDI